MMRCRIIRAVAACRLDDGAELPRWVRRHHAACLECRARYERDHECVRQLAATADGLRVPSPPFLQQRILANLGDWREKPVVSQRWPRPWAVTASLAAVALAFVLVWGPRPARDMAGSDTDGSTQALAVFQKLPDGGTVLALGARLDAPLDDELKLVVADARSAWAALSRSFMPSDRSVNQR